MRAEMNVCNKNYNNVQSPSFNGLTRAMSKSLYVNKAHIDNLVYAYPKAQGFVGSIPKDFIKVLKSNSDNVGASVSEIKSVFADTSKFLQKLAYEKQYASRKEYLKNNCMDSFLVNFAQRYDGNVLALCKDAYLFGRLRPEQINGELSGVNSNLTKVFRENKLIPNDGVASLSYLDSGSYGDVFKLSLLDKDKNKLFHDKVLKVYKSKDDTSNMLSFAIEALHEYVDGFSEVDFINKMNDLSKDFNNSFDDKFFSDYYKYAKNCTKKDFGFMRDLGFTYDFHGVAPEGNAAMYLKKSVGHRLDNTDLIEPYCFDIKNNYAILEMSDTDLKTNKKVNFKELGVTCFDSHTFNYTNDKLIDYGGFNVINSRIVNDKVARRTAKKQAHTPQKKQFDFQKEITSQKNYDESLHFSDWSFD